MIGDLLNQWFNIQYIWVMDTIKDRNEWIVYDDHIEE